MNTDEQKEPSILRLGIGLLIGLGCIFFTETREIGLGFTTSVIFSGIVANQKWNKRHRENEAIARSYRDYEQQDEGS